MEQGRTWRSVRERGMFTFVTRADSLDKLISDGNAPEALVLIRSYCCSPAKANYHEPPTSV